MTKWKIYNEDAVEWAKNYEKGKFHALLTDAPYHLTSITKRFGKNGSAPAKFGKDGVFQRASKGFMGTQWDGGDVAFRPETWEAFGQVLYPGAFGMAFSASRNWHRMAVAIEDAGFVLHPTMFFLWVQGQGFPKATRVKGHEEFDGHRYGLQALKPAVEPIIVFQKPYEGKPVENITSTGAGALNIDGARIGTITELHASRPRNERTTFVKGFVTGTKTENKNHGRWPSNLVLDDEMGRRLDKQTGIQKGGFVRNRTDGARPFNNNGKETGYSTDEVIEESDGGASRFFYQVSTQLEEADPFLYCAKVSPKERNAGLDNKNNHPTLKPISLSQHLATLLLPPDEYAPRRIFVPFSGVASEMIGAGLAGWEHVVGVEFDKENGYVDVAEKRLEYWLKGKQNGI